MHAMQARGTYHNGRCSLSRQNKKTFHLDLCFPPKHENLPLGSLLPAKINIPAAGQQQRLLHSATTSNKATTTTTTTTIRTIAMSSATKQMFEGVGAPVKVSNNDDDGYSMDPTLDSCCQREVRQVSRD
jgi:hypothetical protein